MSKNRINKKQLESKSIPVLELQVIALAVEYLVDLFDEKSGDSCINNIMIKEMIVFSDSIVALSWLNSYSNQLEKMQNQSVFVLNRLNRISKMCESHPLNFSLYLVLTILQTAVPDPPHLNNYKKVVLSLVQIS